MSARRGPLISKRSPVRVLYLNQKFAHAQQKNDQIFETAHLQNYICAELSSGKHFISGSNLSRRRQLRNSALRRTRFLSISTKTHNPTTFRQIKLYIYISLNRLCFLFFRHDITSIRKTVRALTSAK